MGLLERMIRPPDDVTPNPNPPGVPPASVGPPDAVPGDPHGVTIETGPAVPPPPRVLPSAWSGWPAEWWPPPWGGRMTQLTDTAWACVDLNASVLASMPPYLVDAVPSLDAGWLRNPNPDIYTSWEEFAKQLFWDYHLGEAFVIATAYYATGFPARFHVVPPWTVEPEIAGDGTRRYRIGKVDVTPDMLHIRYQSTVSDARGHGPLEAGAGRLVAAQVLQRYAQGFAAAGGVPTSILTHPEELTAQQASELQAQWVQARLSRLGEPAVLSGGVGYAAIQANPKDMALVELSQLTDSRICVLLGVPPFLMGLPSGGDSMTYSNVSSLFDYHWRGGLRPKASFVMPALSQWLLPRGTSLELNRDAYVQPEPEARARTEEIYLRNGVLSIDEVREIERFSVGGGVGIGPSVAMNPQQPPPQPAVPAPPEEAPQ